MSDRLDVDDALPDVGLVDEHGTPWRLTDELGDGRPALIVFHRHLA